VKINCLDFEYVDKLVNELREEVDTHYMKKSELNKIQQQFEIQERELKRLEQNNRDTAFISDEAMKKTDQANEELARQLVLKTRMDYDIN
jgi:hypothetical protein